MSQMRILVISALWPHSEHSVRAANIVICEMLLALSNEGGITVGLLVVGDSAATAISDAELRGISALQKAGVDVLEPLVLDKTHAKRSRFKRLIFPHIVDWYPACFDAHLIAERVAIWKADAIVVPWAEWLTHACSEIPVAKFAYYGNPDPKAARTQLRLKHRTGEITLVRKYVEEILVKRFEYIHLAIMRRYELLGNVAKNDAHYYAEHGHENAFYIQNIWMSAPIDELQEEVEVVRPIKIIGSIGKLGGTANTLGLEYLGKEVLPALDYILQGKPYEIHIFGAGKPHSVSAKALEHPSVIWRGFVQNIDEEIRGCDVFLCVNNATEYKVGHTRYLHAWSLRAPVVAHMDAALSMPEIQHDISALLGGNAIEIAQQIRNIANDKILRDRIKEGGFKAFNNAFMAKQVASTIRSKLDAYMLKRGEHEK